ncbi:hypothetical protein ACNKHT_09430 [Shigella flexneri]
MGRPLAILKALKAKGVHAKLLYSRMGEVTADNGAVLPIARYLARCTSLTVDAGIVSLRQYRGYH